MIISIFSVLEQVTHSLVCTIGSAHCSLPPLPPMSLQYLLCGISEIDVKDWKKHSITTNGYTNESPPVVWFWKVIIVRFEIR